MESRFQVERDRKRHNKRVSLPLAYTRTSHGKSEAAPATVLFLFLFSLFFWGILVTREKWWCKRYEGPFFFFLGGEGEGAGRGVGNRAQSMCPNHRGEKKPNFFLNLLFPDVLSKFLTTRKISIAKILKKEIKESTKIFFKYCFFEQNYFLILQHVWNRPRNTIIPNRANSMK
jgi:hypothetical protein